MRESKGQPHDERGRDADVDATAPSPPTRTTRGPNPSTGERETRFELPERPGIAFLSPEFLLGVIVGAAAVFVGFGVFGLHTGGGSSTPAVTVLSPTPPPTLSAAPTQSFSPSSTLAPSPVPTESAVPTLVPTSAPPAIMSQSFPRVEDSLVGTWTATTGSTAGYRVAVHVPLVGVSQVHGTTAAITGQFDIVNIAGVDV
ncbi:MAG TPA: hypothetical protein VNF73_09530, partial [Candidatus Saccharimonadales bacterium]|nr:hypothetical protein [Candidatus Saccharimonadales bacterium]